MVVSRLGAGDVNIESDSSYDLSSFLSGANREVVNIELLESSTGDDWGDASAVPGGVPDEGITSCINRGNLEAAKKQTFEASWSHAGSNRERGDESSQGEALCEIGARVKA
jgi:hypothetical protein